MTGQTVAQRERFQRLYEVLNEQGTATIGELAESLTVSRMTIHRDLDVLESQGILRKIRNGATVERSPIFESSHKVRLSIRQEEKRAIARVALDLVEPNMSVMLDASSTVYQLSKLIAQRVPLTIITISFPILVDMAEVDRVRLIGLGGVFDPHYYCFMGREAEQAAAGYRADVGFLSLPAIDGKGVLCHSSSEAVRIGHALKSVAQRSVLLIDSSKFGTTALHAFGSVAEFDTVIVDSGISDADLRLLRDLCADVRIAEMADEA